MDFTTVSLTVHRTIKLTTTTSLIDLLTELGLPGSAQEQIWVISLDALNQVRMITPVAMGTYHDCYVAIPAILSPVLLAACDRFILAHNHPTGKANPTLDDIDLTARVEAAADVLDLRFDDHIIVTPTGAWSSMATLGHMRKEAA